MRVGDCDDVVSEERVEMWVRVKVKKRDYTIL
jgi:hypothetical protein